jgi:hypothetical protein
MALLLKPANGKREVRDEARSLVALERRRADSRTGGA